MIEQHVQLTGRLDMDTCSQLAHKITAGFTADCRLVLDFASVNSLDSAALALIFELVRQASTQKVTINMVNAPLALLNLARLYDAEALLQLAESPKS